MFVLSLWPWLRRDGPATGDSVRKKYGGHTHLLSLDCHFLKCVIRRYNCHFPWFLFAICVCGVGIYVCTYSVCVFSHGHQDMLVEVWRQLVKSVLSCYVVLGPELRSSGLAESAFSCWERQPFCFSLMLLALKLKLGACSVLRWALRHVNAHPPLPTSFKGVDKSPRTLEGWMD